MPPRTRQLNDELLKQFGPLIGGIDLRKALGFRSAATFQRAIREKTLKIPIFDVPGRRGKFALTADVATWLATVSNPEHQSDERPLPAAVGGIGDNRLVSASKEGKM